MPQAPIASTRAVDSLSDSNPRELSPTQRLEERSDGSVWLIETHERVVKDGTETVTSERRVDSASDADHVRKGGTVWYRKLLAKQAADAEAAANKTARAKPKGAKSND